MGEKNDRNLKGVQIVPEGRLQGTDITFTLPSQGVLDISLGEEVRLGPQILTVLKTKNQIPTVLKTKNLQFLIPCFRNLTQNPTPFKIFAKKGYPAYESYTMFKTKIPENHTLMGRTSTFSSTPWTFTLPYMTYTQ